MQLYTNLPDYTSEMIPISLSASERFLCSLSLSSLQTVCYCLPFQFRSNTIRDKHRLNTGMKQGRSPEEDISTRDRKQLDKNNVCLVKYFNEIFVIIN